MKPSHTLPGLAALLCIQALAQSSTATPAFEAADVHFSPTTRNPFLRDATIRRGHYEIRFATMVDLVRTAYGIDSERVLGGPGWLENDQYNVIAKIPAGITTEAARPMLQSLLADRFALTFHNDKKAIPAYALRAGKHPQLKESDGSGETGCKFIQPAPRGPGSAPGALVFSYACRNMTMAALAEALHNTIFLAPGYLDNKIVADRTELKGAWNFDLKFSPRNMRGPDGPLADAVSLFDAVDKQLGLKLEAEDLTLPVIVVDSVNRKPTANLPNIAEILHIAPPPTEFEVAEIKPSAPDFQGLRLNIQPGGRVNIAGASLKFIIQQAWDVTDDTLSGAPKWMDTDRYDIVAKAAIPGAEMDIEELWPMLRALITDRFKLVAHTEQRPAAAYTLAAVKPKMKKADPMSRTKYKEGPTPALGRSVICQNMTMAQFAEKLKNIAPGYIHSPVLDATGLEGGYDFTLNFSPAGAVRAGGRGGPGRGGADSPVVPDAASDPGGAVSLFEAIDKQLGLKLAEQKRPVTVLVIDKIEQKPTEN